MNGHFYPKTNSGHPQTVIQSNLNSQDHSTEPTGISSINGASVIRETKDRAMSGVENSPERLAKMRKLVTKLIILLLSNVLISLFCLVFLWDELSYSAACVDMLVSNLCLWLSYSFNVKQYRLLCYFCIRCSRICQSHK